MIQRLQPVGLRAEFTLIILKRGTRGGAGVAQLGKATESQ